MSKARNNVEKSRGIWSEVIDYLVGDVVTLDVNKPATPPVITSYVAIEDTAASGLFIQPNSPGAEAVWQKVNSPLVVTSTATSGGSAGADRISSIVSLSQAEYNAIGSGNYIEDFLYVIKG